MMKYILFSFDNLFNNNELEMCMNLKYRWVDVVVILKRLLMLWYDDRDF